jgi:hypothetical protein
MASTLDISTVCAAAQLVSLLCHALARRLGKEHFIPSHCILEILMSAVDWALRYGKAGGSTNTFDLYVSCYTVKLAHTTTTYKMVIPLAHI